MREHVLVTGGAGFIGSFTVDELLRRGHKVRILDNFEEQVHKVWGTEDNVPPYLNTDAELIRGDVCDYETVKKAIKDVDVIFHHAGMVGVGQSQYQIRRYMNGNVMGTASLLDALANEKHSVRKILVAGSISEYGEGLAKCVDCGPMHPQLRSEQQLANKDWDLHCPECNKYLTPLPTPETKPLHVNSIYAIGKRAQEDMFINIGRTYGIPAVSLRYWNAYGPRQSLGNPYTGVAANFMSMLKNKQQPVIFEDGHQRRDFVSVHDLVQANMLAMDSKAADYEIFNVGSGHNYSVLEIAGMLAKLYDNGTTYRVESKFRKGDIRHCFADLTKIKDKLGYEPKVRLEDGLKELKEWCETAPSMALSQQAKEEMQKRKIVV